MHDMKLNLKNIIKLLFVICLLISNIALEANKSVSIFVKQSKYLNKETDCSMNIIINKQDIEGVSRFEISLPAGVEIEPVEFSQSFFILRDNIAKFIWWQIPKDSTVIISYRLKINSEYKGGNIINGTFSYVDEDVRQAFKFSTLLKIENTKPKVKIVDNNKLNYAIQLGAFSKKLTDDKITELYYGINGVKVFAQENGYYIYYKDGYKSYETAKEFMNLINFEGK